MSHQPDEILKIIKKEEEAKGQGKLKIFMGMVAGVGKTFAMLKSAHASQEQGKTVLVGYVETHRRKETEELLEGLTVLPRKKIPYKNITLEELDIDAILEKKPPIVLIDELAHTNAPGSRHEKRWQDVLEILSHGIDVHTTLNIQHVESISEDAALLTNTTIQELVPDSVIDRANEIVLIDLIPEEVIHRLKSGKIYSKDKIDMATSNFFKVSNLTALRELSLRLVADRVDHELKDMGVVQGLPDIGKVKPKIMVAIFASPYSESLIRYARKLSYGLNCEWIAAYVNTNRPYSKSEQELLNKNIELVNQLGGEVASTQNSSVADGLLHIARIQNATQIVVGKSQKGNLVQQLIRRSGEIDINVVSPIQKMSEVKNISVDRGQSIVQWESIFLSTAYIFVLTVLNLGLLPLVHYRAIGMIYLMGIAIGALLITNYSIILSTVLAALLWDIFFIPPKFTVSIHDPQDWLLLLSYMVAAGVIGTLAKKVRLNETILKNEGKRSAQLYTITKSLSNAKDLDSLVRIALEEVKKITDAPVSLFMKPTQLSNSQPYEPDRNKYRGDFVVPEKEAYALDWVIKNKLPAGKHTNTLPSSKGYYVPLLSKKEAIGVLAMDASTIPVLSYDLRLMLDGISRQISVGMEREQLYAQLTKQTVLDESEKIYKTLLNSVSHEMRTPLSAIQGFATALTNQQMLKDERRVQEFAQEILQATERLDHVVQNLLDMSRIESGQLKLNLDHIDIQELLSGAIQKLKKYYGERNVVVHIKKDFPLLNLDYFLIEQVMENILRNAYQYSPAGTPIDVTIYVEGTNAHIDIVDDGPGIRSKDPSDIFKKFYRENPQDTGGIGLGLSICKSIIEYHQGSISAENVPGRGAKFKITLPL